MKWFNNIRISIKITAACLILILIMAGITFEGMTMLSKAGKAFDSFFDDKFIASNDLNDIMKDVLQIRLNMLEQLVTAQKGDIKGAETRWDDSMKLRTHYLAIWERYKKLNKTSEEKKLIKEWEDARAKLADKTNGFAAAVTAKKFDDADKWLVQWVELYRPWRDLTGELINVQKETGEKLRIQQDEDAAASRRLTMIILGIAVFAGIIITVVLTKVVTGPVRKGLAFANRIADGDFTMRLDLDQTDELGQLAQALNRAADQLEKMVADIILGSQNLSQAVQEIASGNENLSQRTSEQASSLEEVASTIEETTAVIGQTAENSNRADTLVSQTSGIAEVGGKVVYQAVDAINEINDSSKKIEEIISVIDDIAFQTNLLALNAAVEAARAGEQGRGFAVVAGEVRNLAQRSGGAAKEISQLIKMTIEKVEKGTSLANKSGDALKEIIHSINNVAGLVTEIKVSTDEQKQGAVQINTAISELDSMTQQNAGLVEEIASASEEMSNQAQEFMSMMSRFKIRSQM